MRAIGNNAALIPFFKLKGGRVDTSRFPVISTVASGTREGMKSSDNAAYGLQENSLRKVFRGNAAAAIQCNYWQQCTGECVAPGADPESDVGRNV